MSATVNGYVTSALYNVSPFWGDATNTLLESEHSTGTGPTTPVVQTADGGNGTVDPSTLLNSGPSGRRAVALSGSGGGSVATSMSDMAKFEPGYAQQDVSYAVNSTFSYTSNAVGVSVNVVASDPAAGVPGGLIRGTGGGHEANVGVGDVDVMLSGVSASSSSMTLTLQGGMSVTPMIPPDPTQAGTSKAEVDVTAVINGKTIAGTVILSAGGDKSNNSPTVTGTGIFASITGSSVGNLGLNLTGLTVGAPNNVEIHVHTSAEVDHTIAPTGGGAASSQYNLPLSFTPAASKFVISVQRYSNGAATVTEQQDNGPVTNIASSANLAENGSTGWDNLNLDEGKAPAVAYDDLTPIDSGLYTATIFQSAGAPGLDFFQRNCRALLTLCCCCKMSHPAAVPWHAVRLRYT